FTPLPLTRISMTLNQEEQDCRVTNIPPTFLVEGQALNHNMLKPGLEPKAWASEISSQAQAHSKPSSGPGLSGLGSVSSGLRAQPGTSLTTTHPIARSYRLELLK